MQFVDEVVADRQFHVVLDGSDMAVAAEIVEETMQVGDQEQQLPVEFAALCGDRQPKPVVPPLDKKRYAPVTERGAPVEGVGDHQVDDRRQQMGDAWELQVRCDGDPVFGFGHFGPVEECLGDVLRQPRNVHPFDLVVVFAGEILCQGVDQADQIVDLGRRSPG